MPRYKPKLTHREQARYLEGRPGFSGRGREDRYPSGMDGGSMLPAAGDRPFPGKHDLSTLSVESSVRFSFKTVC
jgi:hypothetical protein